MNQTTLVERVRVGAHEVQVAIAGTRLLPTADGASCSCSTSCSVRTR